MTGVTLALAAAAVVGLALAGMLSAGEAAVLRVTRASLLEALQEAEEAGDAARVDRARRARSLAVEPTATVASFALVRVTAEVVALAAATLMVADLVRQDWSVMLVALVAGIAIGVVFVRVSPRELGFRRPVQVLMALVGPLTVTSRAVAWLTRLSVPRAESGPLTDAELRDIAERVGENEAFEEEDRELIRSVIELGGTITREVMVPRTDMVTVPADTPLAKVLRLFLRSGFSRVPVVGASVDDVIGVAYLKDVVAALHATGSDGDAAGRPAAEVARAATFVPESKPVDDLLRQMQAEASHIALVVDEYGGIAGLVTIEDLLEELVGELTDEHDRVPAPEVEDLGSGVLRVPARMPVYDLGQLFDRHLDDDDVDTVGGLLAKTIGKVPLPGSAAEVGGLHLEGERVGGRRKQLATILVHRVHADDDLAAEQADRRPAGTTTEKEDHA